jgi:hypothetical protein
MKALRIILLVIFVLILVCCGGTLKIFLYTSDLINIATGSANTTYVNANIVVENLKEEADINFLKQNLNSFSNEQIVKYNYSDSLSFDVKIPIINIQNIQAHNIEKDLLYIIASEQNNNYSYTYKFNSALVNKIDNYVYRAHYQHIDFSSFETSIIVENDIRNVIDIIASSVYINNQPYPFSFSGELQRRDKIELRISEILRSAILKDDNNTYTLFKINKIRW